MNAPSQAFATQTTADLYAADYAALNQGQRKAVDGFMSFLLSNDKTCRIVGPAGTGKTHVMRFIMRHTIEEYANTCSLLNVKPVNYELELCATTNKAAEVLSVSTGLPAQTIHAFLKLRVKDNYSTGKTEISKTRDWKVHSRKIMFIDEASMVDSQLYTFIQQSFDSTCKIVYLGDHKQMAPVFETLSKVYTEAGVSFYLTQPMRNAGQPALMALCKQLRDTVETGVFHPIQEVPGVIDVLDDAQALQFVDTNFQTQQPGGRILAYSNARVQEYNAYIRHIRGLPPYFVQGEILVNNSPVLIPYNDTMRALAIEREITVLDSFPNEFEQILVDEDDPNSTLDVYPIVFQEGSATNTVKVRIRVPVNYARVTELMRYYRNMKNWDRLFWLKNTFPDFRQRDAATVYKAQGSTYPMAFLDLTNIGSCKHNDQIARMLYVGASRATDRLFFYGALPKRLLPETYIRAGC
jgi:exodeoxyribonuclease-5